MPGGDATIGEFDLRQPRMRLGTPLWLMQHRQQQPAMPQLHSEQEACLGVVALIV